MGDINTKTTVPLFYVLGAFPLLVGGIFWMSSLYATAIRAEQKNLEQDQKLESTHEIILDIQSRVIRIEEKLINKNSHGGK